MINYFDISETLAEIVSNDKIKKEGLIITYELEKLNHEKLNEDFYYRLNPNGKDFIPTDIFEVELQGFVIKFIKKK